MASYDWPISVKLDDSGRNFRSWECLMTISLQNDDDVWKIIKGTLVMPEPADGETELSEEQLEVQRRYKRANARGKLFIFSSIHENLIVPLFYEDSQSISVLGAWTRLKEHFGKDCGVTQDTALSELISFRFLEERTFNENLHRFTVLSRRLTEVGMKLGDDVMTGILLNAIQGDQRPFRRRGGEARSTNGRVDRGHRS